MNGRTFSGSKAGAMFSLSMVVANFCDLVGTDIPLILGWVKGF